MRSLIVLGFIVTAAACRHGPAYDFDPSHVLDVEIEMAPGAWDEMRREHRCLFGDFASPRCATMDFPSPYHWRTATVAIDGESLPNVAIRKKGFGSTHEEERPGLKLKFDKYERGRRWNGIERMTLNTTHDPLRTCLAYSVLADAGVIAPRCAFAAVRLNGEPLGVMPVVEAIDGAFLRRHFADDDGGLYEGVLNDFRADHRPVLEHKRGPPGQAPIDRLTRRLATDGATLESIGEIVDLDRFFTFWAAEVLIGRWDGYAGHTNNYFVYDDPESERLHFIAWGGNRATFEALRDPVLTPRANEVPTAVIAHGVLARRLYESSEGRARYVRALRALLDTVWREDELVARIEAMERTLAPHPGARPSAESLKAFVRARRRAIEDELRDGPPPWPFDPPTSTCMVPAGTARGGFTTTLTSTTSEDRAGAASIEVIVDDAALKTTDVAATAGWMDLFAPNTPIVPGTSHGALSIVVTARLPTKALRWFLVVPRDRVAPGARFELGPPRPGCPGSGPPFGVLCVDGATSCLQPAFVSRGALTLDRAGVELGATISGHFEVELMKHPWGLFEGHPTIWSDGAPERGWILDEAR